MKHAVLITLSMLFCLSVAVDAQAKKVHIKSYNKKNGTHVSSHSRSTPHKKH